MVVLFAKSLDRPVDIFGIRGKWLMVFFAGLGVSLLTAIIAGVATTAGVGIAVAIFLIVLCFLACLMLQGRMSYRQLPKVRASSQIPVCVIRRETLSRILTVEPRYKEGGDAVSRTDKSLKP